MLQETLEDDIEYVYKLVGITSEQKQVAVRLLVQTTEAVNNPRYAWALKKAEVKYPWINSMLHAPVDWYLKKSRIHQTELALAEIKKYL